ncbi:MAG: nucleotidyl transferase AbiEii/AbiGii toxin family protein [Ignavibacteriales bacterium]|nr:nucleotidyl transferase AbiEii/AbiGii toxin family protein [Ignavibacteriales bacterium]
MIPKPYISKWQEHAPWKTFAQVEQDLIINRVLITIFTDKFLRENISFRGGTSIHKLYLKPAPRYSEDIDLVQIKSGPIKPILTRIKEVIDFFEEPRVVEQKHDNNTILYRFISEHEQNRLKVKIEINCREHFSVLGYTYNTFEMENEWFSGNANITTYSLNELLGTKLRALYQRKKGRDLFDLYYAYQNTNLDYNEIIRCYNEYIKFAVKNPPTKKQFLLNLDKKRNDPDFIGDLEGLLRPGIEYNQENAFNWIIKDLIDKL